MSKIRQYFYLGSTAVAGLLPLLIALGALGSDKADAVNQILLQVGSLIGAGAAGTAGVIVAKQRKDGTIDAAPVTPLDQVITNIPVVVAQAAQANADLERLRTAATDVVGDIPLFGKEAAAAIDALPHF
ncbi:holin [Mycobacterium phage Luchador]|uniref:Holin n=1 Tax=Mycobacterium phage Luchador TaxID=1647300 RepID=A0A0F6WDU6_9CAUD|nr:holin [Mycobacterium phage Luchador]AKF14175.1 holin [Mycobacterium phage Luchador]